MKIDLKQERFESIEGAFRNIQNKKNVPLALKTIKANLKSTFDKDITVTIVDNKTKDVFFIMSIYPDISTIDKVVEAVVDEKPDELIKSVWNSADKWTVEIDSKILYGKVIDVNARELTALLLHEIGHIVYSESIPQRISRVMRLEYSRASIEIKHILKDKLFRQVLRLPIINACLYDNYKTKSSIKKELKADFFVVKMGYGEDLDRVLTKLIMLSNSKKINQIDQTPQNVYSDMKSITLFSLSTVEQFKQRKAKIVKDNFRRLLINNPSKFIQNAIEEIENTFIKSNMETSVSESKKINFLYNKIDKIVDEMYMTEMFNFNSKQLKRIDPSEIDYIFIQKNNIKTNDDKMLLISYIYSKIDTIDYYIAIIDSNTSKYTVPHSKEFLLDIKSKLLSIKDEVLQYKIPGVNYGVYINYPEGYEG